MKRSWAPHDTRDEVVDYVRYWSGRTELSATHLVGWLAISRSKYYDWRQRYGKVNEHNAWVPRDHWITPGERDAIVAFARDRLGEGHRRLAYMMIDAGIAAVSATTVYRILSSAGLMHRPNRTPTRKGRGFVQPLRAHEHWHIDVLHLNICGTFYFLCAVLDGFSRHLLHWEIRETMTSDDVQIILQRAREAFPGQTPRMISDNGSQFIARETQQYLRTCDIQHVRTSPNHPQGNGKMERFYGTARRECRRPNQAAGAQCRALT